MSEQLLMLFKFLLLGLLYLFFFRVIRAVWAEMKPVGIRTVSKNTSAPSAMSVSYSQTPTAPAVSTKVANPPPMQSVPSSEPKNLQSSPAIPNLLILAPTSMQGKVYPLQTEMTIGRGAGCSIPLDDSFASQIHARIKLNTVKSAQSELESNSQVVLEDLGSTNGTYVNKQRVQGSLRLNSGDRIEIGNTILELRS